MSDDPGRTLGSKMGRFAVVGVANTVIDLAAFSALLWVAVPPLAANVGAWLVAVAFSFTANRFWSFERDRSIPLGRSVFRFVSLGALISLGVSSLFIAALAGWTGVWPAKIAGIVVAAVLNFLAARWSIEGRLVR
ncbi:MULTISPECIES: GtrA family protein [Phyllobacteriaceae]|jgi:putative flippase GtrA|uniref:Polysaccharide biosynthesis protein GtrA n=1 Tax=Mesorhizobium hungaricum TaxID=1566387 RepID=A0A1C2E5D9_9HYPH|nr:MULTISPECIES: GtrA family protein [Mesorhizobium]MBN9236524.1 GtrA family protein [Mesorhizobium sp.]MDQ0329545.1 putative flippase GtrA [Mesorhizobium sp. YL-MeA3-2017]OCX22208.1 polysaccharide biosynthesis protein GtrA [Mesorhizobium hungaricum]